MKHVLATAILASTALGLIAAPTALAAPVFGDRIWGTAATSYSDAGATIDGTSEIVAFEPASVSTGGVARLYIAAGSFIDVLDARTGSRIASLRLPAGTGTVNSVAIANGKLAASVDSATAGGNGVLAVYDTGAIPTGGSNGLITVAPTRSFTVGAVPDMVAFTPDGRTLLVANEGERAGALDPEGSVSVINVASANAADWSAATAGFDSFSAASLRAEGVRIFGNSSDPSDLPAPKFDLEPEYITISKDGQKAWVGLQENNAVAVIDISNPDAPVVTDIQGLGFKDHSLAGNGLDPSDRDGPANTNIKGNIQTVNNLLGVYMPDGLANFEVNGKRFVVTANEGDARTGLDGADEAVRIGGGAPEARLNITRDIGVDANIDGSVLNPAARYSFGARSFSVLDKDGKLIWDSGDLLEQTLKANYPNLIADNRDDDKGPEPESVEIVEAGGRIMLFVGLERTLQGMVLAFDMTGFDETPQFVPQFIGALIDPDFAAVEGIDTVRFDGNTYLALAFEGSSTTTRGTSLFLVDVPEPATAGLMLAGLAGLGLSLRQRKTA